MGPEDQKFSDSFTDIYTAPSLQKTWYTGNHDYMGNVLAQLGECEKYVESFFIDTTPFVDEYWNWSIGKETFDRRGLPPWEEQMWSHLQMGLVNYMSSEAFLNNTDNGNKYKTA